MMAEEERRLRFQIDVDVSEYVHGDLDAASDYFVDRVASSAAGHVPGGSASERLAALILLAFRVEAYLNFLGERLLPGWLSKERWISAEKRLAHVHEAAGLPLDLTARPAQTIERLRAFRDMVAHAKPLHRKFSEVLEGTHEEARRRAHELDDRWKNTSY